MADGFQYRELIKAMVGYGTETLEEVQARHRAKEKAPTRDASTAPELSTAPSPKKEMDKLNAMLANAKPREHHPVD